MQKILIIQYSSVGELVLSTLLIRCLKLQVKDTEIHLLTSERLQETLQSNPHLSKIHSFNNGFANVFQQIKDEKFDIIIDLHNTFLTFRLKLALATKCYNIKKENWQKRLVAKVFKRPIKQLHLAEKYLETAQKLGLTNDNKGIEFHIDIKNEVNLLKLPGDFPYSYSVFLISGDYFTRKLPKEKILEICQNTSENILLLGGKEDEETGRYIETLCSKNVVNACGKFTLKQMASLIRQSKIVITHHNSLMHIAAAYKKRIISIWGNTSTKQGEAPYKADEKSLSVQINNLKCRPCTKFGYAECPQKHFACMQALETGKISQLIDWLTLPAFSNPNEFSINKENETPKE